MSRFIHWPRWRRFIVGGSAAAGHWRLLAAVSLVAGSLAALAVAGLLYFSPVRSAVAPPPYPHELTQVRFAVAGDVIPHDAVRAAAAAHGPGEQGWAALLNDVAGVFRSADFGFVNLETPVAPDHSHGTKPFMFNAPLALPQALKASGIRIVSFANNHVMDQGWAGFAETLGHLRQIGLLFAGTGDTAQDAWQPVITQANGITVGWLGMTRWLNGNRNPDTPGQPHVNFFPYPGESSGAPGASEDEVLAAIRAARAKCDFLVVSIHWGIEYASAPRSQDVELAHKMLDAGASVIVGHHPHVLQPIETYHTADGRNTIIFYSLGNFLSNQSRTYIDGLMPDREGDPRDALIALFSAVKMDYGPAGTRVELGHVGILPVWGVNNRNQIARGKASAPDIHPVLIDREIPLLQAQLDALTRAAGQNLADSSAPPASGVPGTPPAPPEVLTPAQKQQFIEITTRLKLLTDRRAQILARVGGEFLIEPPPAGH
ncbi:MAG TPA: CapA family protein [Terracidiphilus sp.]|nr:CapA family protein [Terracidiphilus sp.]